MAPQIFMTGVSGYVGGQLLHDIVAKHLDWHITGLVRTEEQAKKITSRHPSVHLVIGDLDSSEAIIEQSKQANVVIQTADIEHTGATKAIFEGLSLGAKDGLFIQLSGEACIIDNSTGLGQPTTKIWDDIADFDEISKFDETHIHATSDQFIINEGKRLGIRTVIAAPSLIYGRGEGIKESSMGYPWYIEITKKRGKGFLLGEGKNLGGLVHVKDVAAVLLYFAEQGLASDGGNVEWGEKGWYFVEAEEVVFKEVAAVIVNELFEKGEIKTLELDSLTAEDASGLHPWGPLMWGMNMRSRASRLRSLGWTPKYPRALDTVSELLISA